MKTPFHFDRQSSKRSLILIAVLVIAALFGHSFDACAAHLGIFNNFATHSLSLHRHISSADCTICAAERNSSRDACDTVSEVAVRTGVQQNLDIHVVATISNFAIIPVVPSLLGASNFRISSLPSSPPTAFALHLRSVLPVRAPPFFA